VYFAGDEYGVYVPGDGAVTLLVKNVAGSGTRAR